jgi:methylase of polypeptide subunit release factors
MEELGRELQMAGLNELSLAQLFGPAWTSDDVQLVLDRYRADDPRTALVRAFVLGEPVEAGSLPVAAERLAEAGLVELSGETATARVRLVPSAGLLVAHDGDPSRPDFVTGVNAASRTLATLTVRRPCRSALDLGTGSGVEALLAARHAGRVVATDINPRALEYAALGARLNGLELELREGSLFDPVEGERFDLIVANPPFVISPDTDFVYRDSALPGDAICREVVRGAAAHLEPGGFATVLCNWICRTREERWEPLRDWVDGLECDALLFAHGAIDPFRYASRWNEPLRSDPSAYASAVSRWLDYYEREGIVAIGIGAVILRGREGPGWIRGFNAPHPATGSAGDHILRLFAAAEREGGDMLEAHVGLVRGHRLDQTLVYGDGYEVAGVTMSLAEGVGLAAEIDPEVVPLLFELEPGATVRAAALASDVDPARAAATIERLIEHGLLDARQAPATGSPPTRSARS